MVTYYVDLVNGSDGNDGSSWASAWRTCHPLVALYKNATSIYGLEVRFAKTVPIETDRTITLTVPDNYSSTYLKSGGVARPYTGFCKPVFLVSSLSTAVASAGGTVLSPFTSPESTYYQLGTGKIRIQAPPSTSGYAARWAISGGVDFSSFQNFEVAAALSYSVVNDFDWDTDEPCTAQVWLEFATDTAGTNVVWSAQIPAGKTKASVKLCSLGEGDLPSNAPYAFIRIQNTTARTVWLYLSGIWAVLPTSHINYAGYKLIYVPNSNFGLTLSPVYASTSFVNVWFNGCDGPGIDLRRTLYGEAVRTWTTYIWEPYPYEADPIFKDCQFCGTPDSPVRFIGGWNTSTNTVDGITAVDAANIRLFSNVKEVTVDVRNLAIAMRRHGMYGNDGVLDTPGIMEYTSKPSKLMDKCYAEKVYIPAAGLGVVDEHIGESFTSWGRDALLTASVYNPSSSVSFKDCNTHVAPPFVGIQLNYKDVEGSAWGMMSIFCDSASPSVFYGCTLVSAGNVIPGWDGTEKAPKYVDCDIIATSTKISTGDATFMAPRGVMEGCRLWGAKTGPTSISYPSKNLVFNPLPGVLGNVASSSVDIDGFLLPLQDASLGSASLFMLGAHKVARIKNAVIYLHFGSIGESLLPLYPFSRPYYYEFENVVLHKTNVSGNNIFVNGSVKATNLTMSGAWASVFNGYVQGADIDTLAITDASTKLVENFSFLGPGAGWGRVSFSVRNLIHPQGLQASIGNTYSLTKGPGSGAGWVSTSDEEMWFTESMSVTRDLSVRQAGLSSWRITARRNLGSLSRGSFLVGAVPVTAGVPVVFSAMMRRSSADAIGGLLIRPGATREFLVPPVANTQAYFDTLAYQNPNQVPEIWTQVTATYTPYREGLVELHVGMRGSVGTNVWVDSLQVSQ